MTNATKFLNAYSSIEKFFTINSESGKYHSFSSNVNYFAKKNSVIKHFQDDLIEYAQLRNAIVHDRVEETEIIAEPHDRVVENIQTIASLLNEPPTLKKFRFKELLTCELDDLFADVLNKMSQKGYSQVPVLKNGQITNLLSASMIVHYIYQSIHQNKIQLDGVKVSDVLEKQTHHFKVVEYEETIMNVLELFNESHEQGKTMFGLIVKDSKSNNDQPIGLLTLKDLPALMSLILRD